MTGCAAMCLNDRSDELLLFIYHVGVEFPQYFLLRNGSHKCGVISVLPGRVVESSGSLLSFNQVGGEYIIQFIFFMHVQCTAYMYIHVHRVNCACYMYEDASPFDLQAKRKEKVTVKGVNYVYFMCLQVQVRTTCTVYEISVIWPKKAIIYIYRACAYW